MLLRKWDELPVDMQCDVVREYYNILSHRVKSLVCKRLFDIVMSFILIIVLSPVFLVIAIAIAADSRGGVFFRQTRVTSYGKEFRIFKFRTMVANAEKIGSQVTIKGDIRVTRVGKILRDCRLDELPQLYNILKGDMTFVGSRPELVKYVVQYTPIMKATLLLPAGVTSEASIYYKDECKLLGTAEDVDRIYVDDVLPNKMYYNLRAIEKFSFMYEIITMVRTVLAVCGKKYVGDLQDNNDISIDTEKWR